MRQVTNWGAASDDGLRWCEDWRDTFRRMEYADEALSLGHKGWYGDAYGEGHQIIRGAVFQLPGRAGEEVWLAGYADPNNDHAARIDCGTLWSEASDAAHDADRIAERQAEREREWDAAWVAGAVAADLDAEIKHERTEALALARERRRALAATERPEDFPTLCEMARDAVAEAREAINEARDTIARLRDGDGPEPHHHLSFHPTDELRAQFDEGRASA